MAKYRIKVEVLDSKEKVSEELLNGWECDGFFLGMDIGDNNRTIISNLSIVDIAGIIAPDTKLLEAAIIARAMDEARLTREGRERQNIILSMIKRMAGDD